MRRSLGKLSKSTIIGINATTTHYPLLSFSIAYSTAGGGGGGRGRGRGSSPPPSSNFIDNFQPSPGSSSSHSQNDDDSKPFPSTGMGHGRGKPLLNPPSFSPSPIPPASNPSPSSSSSNTNTSIGRGRGRGSTILGPQSEQDPQQSPVGPKKPIFFFLKEEESAPVNRIRNNPEESSNLPSSILKTLPGGGAGRGKPLAPPSAAAGENVVKEENRHLRARQQPGGGGGAGAGGERLSPEEARKKAMGILSRGGEGVVVDEEQGVERGGGGGRGFRGRDGGSRGGRGGRVGGGGGGGGGRGMMQSGSWRGRGRGRGGRGRGSGRDRRGQDDEKDGYGTGLYLGDDADGEKLAARIGPENMNKLVEGFEEMSGSVLPSPMEDAFVEALHTNYMIECEPEYLMEEFGTNPDIDEKPPIPLRDALEKMKPFLMVYEGIQSQEEWEEVMKETMEQVPLLKEIVDHYSGPDRVTAKRQQEELERVAKTLPDSAPTSVKRFTDRALLSLQSNPGWGFDKKCQFMDKLVWEVSQQYK